MTTLIFVSTAFFAGVGLGVIFVATIMFRYMERGDMFVRTRNKWHPKNPFRK